MIKTVADFLMDLKSKGTELIKKYEIVDHPVLIGDMYEGLTKEILNKAIFANLNLKIVGGKIKNSQGNLSNEIDCMIVEGIGEQIPYTEKYIYHFTQVIAVVEVKKSLYTNTLDDSYSNLRSVINVSREFEKDGEDYLIEILRDSWKSMLRIELPKRSELEGYTETEQHIYHTLLMEAYFPLRIVFGYYGFKTEYSLREGFANFLDSKSKVGVTKGYGAGSLPSLIICGNNTIVKNNGMPYGESFTKEEHYWPIYFTSRKSPINHLLEIIWTRISYKFGLSPQIFGDDSEFEPMHKFINCKLAYNNNNQLGWAYNYSVFSEKDLSKSVNKIIKWTPSFLTKEQFAVVTTLCSNEYINVLTDEEFNRILSINKLEKDIFIKTLVETNLIFFRNDEIRLLTDNCQTVILPDGRFCAGENKNNELFKWLNNYMIDFKNSK